MIRNVVNHGAVRSGGVLGDNKAKMYTALLKLGFLLVTMHAAAIQA